LRAAKAITADLSRRPRPSRKRILTRSPPTSPGTRSSSKEGSLPLLSLPPGLFASYLFCGPTRADPPPPFTFGAAPPLALHLAGRLAGRLAREHLLKNSIFLEEEQTRAGGPRPGRGEGVACLRPYADDRPARGGRLRRGDASASDLAQILLLPRVHRWRGDQL